MSTSSAQTQFSTTQIVSLTSAQVLGLTTTQVGALNSAQTRALSTAQLGVLSTTQVVALSTAGVVGLSSVQLGSLSTVSVRAMETRDVAALRSGQLGGLGTVQLAALSSVQLAALVPSQLKSIEQGLKTAFTSTQLAYLSTAQLNAIYVTPLVLDLDGNGVSTRSLAQGVEFDIDADGQPDRTGWIGQNDGLLVRDINRDGVVNDGSELFGSSTKLPDGNVAQDGFQALSGFDTNSDGFIDESDPVFENLQVWVDGNADGLTDPGELLKLADFGIQRMSLNSMPSSTVSEGNLVGLRSEFERLDGGSGELADVWFQVSSADRLDEKVGVLGELLKASVDGLEVGDTVGRTSAQSKDGIDRPTTIDTPLAQSHRIANALTDFARIQTPTPTEIGVVSKSTERTSSHLSQTRRLRETDALLGPPASSSGVTGGDD